MINRKAEIRRLVDELLDVLLAEDTGGENPEQPTQPPTPPVTDPPTPPDTEDPEVPPVLPPAPPATTASVSELRPGIVRVVTGDPTLTYSVAWRSKHKKYTNTMVNAGHIDLDLTEHGPIPVRFTVEVIENGQAIVRTLDKTLTLSVAVDPNPPAVPLKAPADVKFTPTGTAGGTLEFDGDTSADHHEIEVR